MIAQFTDDVFPKQKSTHIRYTARALVIDEQGLYGFLHIVGEDQFGRRDHYETCGGGIEEKESAVAAILREVEEEMGYTGEIVADIGVIADSYSLIQRETHSHFFVVHVKRSAQHETNYTASEKELFSGIVWVKAEEIADLLVIAQPHQSVADLVHQRDLFAFQYYTARNAE